MESTFRATGLERRDGRGNRALVDSRSTKRARVDRGPAAVLETSVNRPGPSTIAAGTIEDPAVRLERMLGDLSVCIYCGWTSHDLASWREIHWPAGDGLQARSLHTICPQCYETIVKPEVARVYARLRAPRTKPDVAIASMPFRVVGQ